MKHFLLLIVSFFCVSTFSQIETQQLETAVFNKIVNYKKKLNSWTTLSIDTSMTNSCRNHSIYMSSIDDLQHIGSFQGIKGKSEIIQYTTCYGENCDIDKMATRILNNFLKSPPHKENIDDKSSEIGIGIYIKTEKNVIESPFSTETYITQYFWITIRFY